MAVCMAMSTAHAEVITGSVERVIDGDTLEILGADNRLSRIRLAEIDAPETSHAYGEVDQPGGRASLENLQNLAHRMWVIAKCEDRKSYDRLVCHVSVNGLDLGKQQVKDGMAWAFPRYVIDPSLYDYERMAKESRKGLWSLPSPVAPWIWRDSMKRRGQHE
jgi:micrococcal nuclease